MQQDPFVGCCAALRCLKPGSFVIVRGWGCMGQAGLYAGEEDAEGMLCEPACLCLSALKSSSDEMQGFPRQREGSSPLYVCRI